MTLPASTHVGRLYVESRHRPATRGGGGDIHDAMATPFGVRLLVGDVMGTGPAANRTGLSVLNAWRELAFTEPSLAGIAVRLHSLIAEFSEHPERFVTALLVNFPVPDERPGSRRKGRRSRRSGWVLGRVRLLRASAAAAAARRVPRRSSSRTPHRRSGYSTWPTGGAGRA